MDALLLIKVVLFDQNTEKNSNIVKYYRNF